MPGTLIPEKTVVHERHEIHETVLTVIIPVAITRYRFNCIAIVDTVTRVVIR